MNLHKYIVVILLIISANIVKANDILLDKNSNNTFTISNEESIFFKEDFKPEKLIITDVNDKVLIEYESNNMAPYAGDFYKILVSNCQIQFNSKTNSLKDIKNFKIKFDDIIFNFDFNEPTCHSIESKPEFQKEDKPKVNETKSEPSISVNNFFKLGQNVLSDAKFLMTKNKGEWTEERKKELGNVTFDEAKSKLLSDYKIDINDILNDAFLKNIPLSNINNSREGAFGNGSNIAKTDVTNFATGMARFLADRAKQELNESFFSQMRKQMDKVEELKLFFPESNLFLNQLDANTMDFNLDQLRTKFNHDIEKLPYNIYNATQNDYIINKYSQFQNLRNYLDTDKNGILVDYALSSALQTQGRVNPKELLYNFAHGPGREKIETKQLDNTTKNIINSIKLAELLSNSLLSAEKDRYWVTKEEITELLSDDELFKTYIGLVLAKSEFNEYTIKFGDESFKSLIENKFIDSEGEVSKDLTTLKNLIQNIHQSYAQADEVAKELKNINAEKAVNESYKIFNVFKNNLESINSQLSLISFSSGKNYEFNTELIYKYITPAVDISYNIFSKQYNLAIKNFTILLNDKADKAYHKNIQEFLKDKEVAKIEIIKFYSKKQHYNSLIEGTYEEKTANQTVINKLNDSNVLNEEIEKLKSDKKFRKFLEEENKSFNTFLAKFNTYGTLIANVAVAQNSDEVKAAIEASVLPVGSSRIKRSSDYSITLNAYVGGFAGRAYFKEFETNKSISTFGVTAPIGVSFSKGNIKIGNQNTALGVTLQLIDLGSLVNFYMKEGDGAQLPNNNKIELGDIIAPGGLISYSIGDTPFSILGGVQYVPNLSRMEGLSTDNNFKSLTWRWHFGIAIDIPLFNIKVWN